MELPSSPSLLIFPMMSRNTQRKSLMHAIAITEELMGKAGGRDIEKNLTSF